jgi:hypothetical protein
VKALNLLADDKSNRISESTTSCAVIVQKRI